MRWPQPERHKVSGLDQPQRPRAVLRMREVKDCRVRRHRSLGSAALVLRLGGVAQQVRQHERAVEHDGPRRRVPQRHQLVGMAKLRRVEEEPLGRTARLPGSVTLATTTAVACQHVGPARRVRTKADEQPPAAGAGAVQRLS
eukprot:5595464-Prymnesium_polylepis.1